MNAARGWVRGVAGAVLLMMAPWAIGAGPAATQAAAERAILWGEAVNGAQLGVRFDRGFYGPAQNPRFEIVLRAAGEKGIVAVLPDADPKSGFRPLVKVSIYHEGQLRGCYPLDGQVKVKQADAGTGPLGELKAGEKRGAKFFWSNLTGSTAVGEHIQRGWLAEPGVYRVQVSYAMPAMRVPAPGGGERSAPRVAIGSGWAVLEVTERDPAGPATTQPRHADLLHLPGSGRERDSLREPDLRMEFGITEQDNLRPGIAAIRLNPIETGRNPIELWKQVLAGKREPGGQRLVGRLPGENYAVAIERFMREGRDIRIHVKRRFDPFRRERTNLAATYLTAPLPALLPGKYQVTMDFETVDRPPGEKEPEPLTCSFEVPEPEGVVTAELPEVFENRTTQALRELEKQDMLRVELVGYRGVGPALPRRELEREVELEVSGGPAARVAPPKEGGGLVIPQGMVVYTTPEMMKKVVLLLARSGYLERAEQSQLRPSGVQRRVEVGGYWMRLTDQEEAWLLQDLAELLGAECPAGVKELGAKAARKAADRPCEPPMMGRPQPLKVRT